MVPELLVRFTSVPGLLPGRLPLVSIPCVEPLMVPALLPVTDPALTPTDAALAPA